MGQDQGDEKENDVELSTKNGSKAPDAEEGNGRKRRMTVMEFTKKSFRDSLLTGVPNIVNSNSIPRKTYKSLVILLSLIGFIYQIWIFFENVLTYPTSMSVNIERPKRFLHPAYTFCSNNVIEKSKFCGAFPAYCKEPEDVEAFCRKHPNYYDCKMGSKNFVIPNKSSSVLAVGIEDELLMELSPDLKSLLLSDSQDMSEPVVGPVVMHKDEKTRFVCYHKYTRFINSLPPDMYVKDQLPFLIEANQFTFDPEEQEVLHYDGRAGIFFAIHSPFEMVSPYLRGIFLKTGRTYKIFVRLLEERLLPSPYDTKCLNYKEVWLKNNKSGPRSQAMCIQKCIMDISMKCFNCVVPFVLYPTDERFCKEGEFQECKNMDESMINMEVDECIDLCLDDCRVFKYEYTVQERYSSGSLFDSEGNESLIYVDIYFEDSEIMVYNYKPKYSLVEIFSNIGGFIGIWLGFCLISVADFFESLFDICRYAYRIRNRN